MEFLFKQGREILILQVEKIWIFLLQKTATMYRILSYLSGKLCLNLHYQPTWSMIGLLSIPIIHN